MPSAKYFLSSDTFVNTFPVAGSTLRRVDFPYSPALSYRIPSSYCRPFSIIFVGYMDEIMI